MAKKSIMNMIMEEELLRSIEEEKKIREENLREAIERVWSPTGETQDMDFYSPVMIKEFLTEWTDATLWEINNKMQELGFGSETIDRMHCWIVYEKNSN